MNQNKRNEVYPNEYLFESSLGGQIKIDLSNHGVSPQKTTFENQLYNRLVSSLGDAPEKYRRRTVNTAIKNVIENLEPDELKDWQGADAKKVTLVENVKVLEDNKFKK